ncbi:FMRFamide receptor-like [Tubulanus polymorphus]|uniref:FMRFamide receptor-like n=1 Tax=Tubulanus polymorphus TaxID=672921 RepID=UPI003DA65F70
MDVVDPNFGIKANLTGLGVSTTVQSGTDEIENYKRYEQFIMFQFIMIGILGYTVMTIGVIGNCLSFSVLSRGWKDSSIYVYLSGIAVADLLTLVTMAFMKADTLSPDMMKMIQIRTQFSNYLIPYFHPLSLGFQLVSIYMTVALTVDRFIYICLPFKASFMCRPSRAWKVVVGLYVACMLYQIPRWFEFETKVSFDKEYNNTVALLAPTELARHYLYRHINFIWLYIPVALALPILALCILNGLLIHAVIKSNKDGKVIGATTENQDKSTTIMLISVVIFFLLCQMPALFQNFIYAEFVDFNVPPNFPYLYFNVVSTFLILLNSSANIFIYCYFGPRFRNELAKQFKECCGRCSHRSAENSYKAATPCCPMYTRRVSGMSATSETELTDVNWIR